jgi:hypothetical protein
MPSSDDVAVWNEGRRPTLRDKYANELEEAHWRQYVEPAADALRKRVDEEVLRGLKENLKLVNMPTMQVAYDEITPSLQPRD